MFASRKVQIILDSKAISKTNRVIGIGQEEKARHLRELGLGR